MYFSKTRDVKTPTRGTDQSAGLDFYIPYDAERIVIEPGKSINIGSGIKMEIPKGYAGVFFNKSGVGVKGVFVGACVVDSDYRGEIHLNVHNVSDQPRVFDPGQKLVQMVILPINMIDLREMSSENFDHYCGKTQRGSGGFGSTGEF